MGRWSGSTGPCSRSGLIGGCTGLTPPETAPCRSGFTGTTCTAPTPPSAAGHPSAESTTSLATTPSVTQRRDVFGEPARPGPRPPLRRAHRRLRHGGDEAVPQRAAALGGLRRQQRPADP